MRVAAAGVIYQDGRILLGRRALDRDYYPGAWDIFGGHSLANENLRDTLIRELSEELGIIPTAMQLAFIVTEPKPETYGAGEFHIFLVTDWTGEAKLCNSEHDALGWFTLEELAQLELADKAIVNIIEKIISFSTDEKITLSK